MSKFIVIVNMALLSNFITLYIVVSIDKIPYWTLVFPLLSISTGIIYNLIGNH